jgi:hypothetical protein
VAKCWCNQGTLFYSVTFTFWQQALRSIARSAGPAHALTVLLTQRYKTAGLYHLVCCSVITRPWLQWILLAGYNKDKK